MAKLAKLVIRVKGDAIRVQAFNRAARGRTVLHSEIMTTRENLVKDLGSKDNIELLNLPVNRI